MTCGLTHGVGHTGLRGTNIQASALCVHFINLNNVRCDTLLLDVGKRPTYNHKGENDFSVLHVVRFVK